MKSLHFSEVYQIHELHHTQTQGMQVKYHLIFHSVQVNAEMDILFSHNLRFAAYSAIAHIHLNAGYLKALCVRI